jgi:hypothetical protein
LQHIAIQKETFAGLIRELKRIAISKYLILLLGIFNSEALIYFINPYFLGLFRDFEVSAQQKDFRGLRPRGFGLSGGNCFKDLFKGFNDLAVTTAVKALNQ